MISAVIFDMDGLLINSEPLWRRAEIEAFARAGAPLTEAMCLETTGLRIDHVIDHWQERFGFPAERSAEIERDLVDAVCGLVKAEGRALPGAVAAVEYASRVRPLGLASASPHEIIASVLERLDLRRYFAVIHSADDELYGKPHPGVFLTTAERLRVRPTECLVLEDSLNGVLAAKAARMRCLAVPESERPVDPRFVIADRVLPSLEALDEGAWRELLA